MEWVFSLGAIVLVNILAWITPGPNMFAVITASLMLGRRHGLMTGFGLALGAVIWSIFAVFGVAILFDLFPKAVSVLKLLGAVYLIWLGIKTASSVQKKKLDTLPGEEPDGVLGKSFLTGFTVSITNPKAALFFGSVMTAFIPATATGWFLALVVMVCGVLAVVLHSITASLFSTKVVGQFFDRFQQVITNFLGLFFIAVGGSIVFASLREQFR